MSGHSKWSKVKHQKATTDVVKGQAFTKASQAITLAVREGGSASPEANFRLRLALEKARAINMPKETIQRAIERAQGQGGAAIEAHVYEAYGPAGLGILIEVTTDNRARTVSQIKNILERAGGALAEPGAVSFLFNRQGILEIPKREYSPDKVLAAAIDAGADDVVENPLTFTVFTPAALIAQIKDRLEQEGLMIESAEFVMRPTTTVPVETRHQAKIDELVSQLEELTEVQKVYTNAA